jgi:hypothetical protein
MEKYRKRTRSKKSTRILKKLHSFFPAIQSALHSRREKDEYLYLFMLYFVCVYFNVHWKMFYSSGLFTICNKYV